MKKMLAASLTVVLFGTANSLLAVDQSAKIAELEKRIEKLEKALSIKNSSGIYYKKSSYSDDKENAEKEKLKARSRMAEDRKRYSYNQRKEIETLYQSRGYKHGSAEKTKNLKKVISKFSRANRAGCAMLYLGQFSSTGQEQEDYLKKAYYKYDDCFYGNGVQVGAYAMYWLAVRVYLKEGKTNQAYALLKKLKYKYPNAIDHRGKRLAPQIDMILSKAGM